MRLLVTGGCGFIGSNFISYILDKYDDVTVINLDKLTYAGNVRNLLGVDAKYGQKRYFFVRGDIADRELVPTILADYDITHVVNFAAESHVDRSIADPAPFITTNVMGTNNLLQACLSRDIQLFVQISTDEVYGTLGLDGKFTETTPLAPNSPYSASKASADLLARAYFETYKMPIIITRCSNNYGAYQFPEKLIPLMITLAKNDESLPVYGDGLNVRDWIYVMDHCVGVDLAMRKGVPGRIYNFGGEAERNNLEVVRTILQILNKPESLIRFVKDRPGHDRRYAMDFTLAKDELGFSPSLDFESGLLKTVEWYERNDSWVQSVRSGEYLSFMDEWYRERK